jgi:hypothetical protein
MVPDSGRYYRLMLYKLGGKDLTLLPYTDK